MDNEKKAQLLTAEIKKLEESLVKSEDNYIKRMERLNNQLIGLQEAVKILKK